MYVRTTSAHLPMHARQEVADFAPDPSSVCHLHLAVECGSMACRIPIFRFRQHCSTEATVGFVRRIVAKFARFFSFLILTTSSRTCSGTQKVSRISVLSLLYCSQLIHHRMIRFSSIQMLSCSESTPSDFEVWFPICVSESRTESFLGTHTNSQGSLIG